MIPVSAPTLGEREREYVLKCLDSTWISSGGPFVTAFEAQFAAYCGAGFGVTTTNGTTALHLALAVLGIGPGHEVIIPSLTIASCAFAVDYVGAKPVLVDSEPTTSTIDPAQIEERVTPRTRAIMPVHLYGHPANMGPILEIAHRHGLFVVEDAAEAHGAKYKGNVVGGLGDIGCFSFYANKLVTTGEGGMVVTSDPLLAERARRLRDLAHSTGRRFVHDEIGYNFRMTNLQAAVGLAQLERLEQTIATKRWMAGLYKEMLWDVPGLVLPYEEPWAHNIYWMYAVRLTRDAALTRDAFMARLRERGVDSRTFFVPMHTQPVFRQRGWFEGERYPVAEELAATGCYLPSGPAISEEQIRTVCAAVREVLGAS